MSKFVDAVLVVDAAFFLIAILFLPKNAPKWIGLTFFVVFLANLIALAMTL